MSTSADRDQKLTESILAVLDERKQLVLRELEAASTSSGFTWSGALAEIERIHSAVRALVGQEYDGERVTTQRKTPTPLDALLDMAARSRLSVDELEVVAAAVEYGRNLEMAVDTAEKSAVSESPEYRYDAQRRCMTRCQSNTDGDCYWEHCPQLRDGEPAQSGRHCPLDVPIEGD